MKNKISTFEQISSELYNVYGQQSIIPMLFGLASVFKEEITSTTYSFPILFLKGTFATGKSTLSFFIQEAFSGNTSTQSLVNNYEYSELFTAVRNASGICVFDEYRANDRSDLLLKNAYSPRSFHLGKGNREQSIPKPIASFIVLSKYNPTDAPLLSRSIFIENEFNNYSQTQIENYRRLQELFQENNCKCLDEIYSKREHFKSCFERVFKECNLKLYPFSKSGMRRITENYSIIAAVYYCLKDKIIFPFSEKELHSLLVMSIKNQEELVIANDM
ncbi:MAG: hypothetical protein RLZZ540_2246 [Bacteroidota bacterium]|jgi:hypothetical protein